MTEETAEAEEPQDSFGVCAVHDTFTEITCEACQTELTLRGAALDQIMAANGDALDKLKAQGAQLDPASLLNIRLDTLITMIMPEIRHRYIFEMNFHKQISQVIDGLQKEVTKSKLLSGVAQMPNKPNRAQRRRN